MASRNNMTTDNTLARGIANFRLYTYEGLEAEVTKFADELETYMMTHASWEDRTGDARDGLGARKQQRQGTDWLGIDLFHTVYYGFYLEVRWGGKYAIILPTIETMGPELLSRWNRLISEITYYA